MSAPAHADLQAALDAERAKCVALQAEIERITEAGRAHIRRAAAFEAQRDELAARLAEIEAQAVSAMTREDAALLCEEVSSDLIEAMMRKGVDQDEARSLTAAARLCASEIRAGYVAAKKAAEGGAA